MTEYKFCSLGLTNFIKNHPSCYHVVDSMRKMLVKQDLTELFEQDKWTLEPGKGYFVVRADSSIIAFQIPEDGFNSYQLIAAHSDSPSFKIKENPEIKKNGHYISLNVEKYGGMLCSPWFDRPLSVAGRVFVEEDGQFTTKLVNVDKDILMLPSLAIHMDREANSGHKYDAQKELIPLFGDESAEGKFMELIASSAGVAPDAILGHDLFLYNRSAATLWGDHEEFTSAPKLDDLQCAYSAINAFMNCHTEGHINVCCIFDNEEVGSSTKQGADSTFLSDTLRRISSALGLNADEHLTKIAGSFMLSADNGHAVHPNFPEKSDVTNQAYMNKGVLIKYNANQKYTSDAVSAGIFKAICKKNDIPYQVFVNNSNEAGGSTLGNISNTHVSINTVDIGVAQLAMHSPYETCGTCDTKYLMDSMTAFYNTHIEKQGVNNYKIK